MSRHKIAETGNIMLTFLERINILSRIKLGLREEEF